MLTTQTAHVRPARWITAFAVGAIGLAFSQPAVAIPDTTQVIRYAGNSPVNGVGEDVIGTNFDTDLVNATRTVNNLANPTSMTLVLTYHTQYDNQSTGARYADVFFRFPGGQASSNPFTIGAALGFQSATGGLAANLLGNNTFSFQTSQDIWSANGGSQYGGRFSDSNDPDGLGAGLGTLRAAPTRVTNGTDIGDVTAVRTGSNNNFDLTVTITSGNAAFIAATGSANPFDVFWGTGDCSNDAILVTLAFPNRLDPIPEPASLAVLGAGLLGLGMTVRRRRRA